MVLYVIFKVSDGICWKSAVLRCVWMHFLQHFVGFTKKKEASTKGIEELSQPASNKASMSAAHEKISRAGVYGRSANENTAFMLPLAASL